MAEPDPEIHDPKERAIAKRIRRAARVIVYTMTGWFFIQWFGGRLGFPPILLPLIDFVAILGFVWVLIEVLGIYKISRS